MVGAAGVAAELSLAHAVCAFDWNTDAEARSVITEDALWSDGQVSSHGFARPHMPRSLAVTVTGNGGETGRAWYYRWLASHYRDPSRHELVRALGHLRRRIADAEDEVHHALDERLRRRVAEVQELTPLTGWRTLDALYEEWRGRRFVRARLPRQDGYTVAALSAMDLNRALVSLPQNSRLGDGFHRTFIERHAPALAPPPPSNDRRRFVPPMLRRLTHRFRSRTPPPPKPWLMAGEWGRFPETRGWINEAVLADPDVRIALGESWATALTTGFGRNDSHATETVLRLASLIALRDQTGSAN